MLSGPVTVPSGGKGLKVQRNRENSCESSEFESVKAVAERCACTLESGWIVSILAVGKTEK